MAAAAPSSIEHAMAIAALRVSVGDTRAAAQIVADALAVAPPGNAGWLLPIEPLIDVRRDRDPWTPALTLLRERAS